MFTVLFSAGLLCSIVGACIPQTPHLRLVSRYATETCQITTALLLRRNSFSAASTSKQSSLLISTQPKSENPEPYHDRARARAELGRYEEAFADYCRAIQLDQTEHVLQDWEVDDGLFSMLIAWAQSLGSSVQAQSAQVQVMERYLQLLPNGQHKTETGEWILRFRGLLKSTFVKPQG